MAAPAPYAKDQPSGFVNRIEHVAIVGASGQMGRHIAEALVKTGKHTITALTRGSSQLPVGVKSAQVDYENQDSLISALRGQQVLIICLAGLSPPDTHDKIVEAAAKAGVPLIMPNTWGADMQNPKPLEENLVGPGYLAAVKKIEELGLQWTSLCSSFWYEFSLAKQPGSYGFWLPERKVVLFDDGTTKINTSTWEQCARAVAAWLSLKALPEDVNDTSPNVYAWKNRPIYISSFLVSQRDMLDSLNRVQGTTDSDWDITHENVKERYQRGLGMLQKGDMMGFVIGMYSRMFFPGGGGDYETGRKGGLDNEILGLPKESLDEATAKAVKMAGV